MTPKREMCDVYTVDGTLTGRVVPRLGTYMPEGDYVKSVLVLVRTPDERFLITRRSLNKSWAPGQWELPGGGVRAGESSAEAAARELLEETGLDVTGVTGKQVFSYHREAPGDNYIVDIYRFDRAVSPDEVVLEPSETTDFRLATAGEIAELSRTEGFLHFQSVKSIFSLTDQPEK